MNAYLIVSESRYLTNKELKNIIPEQTNICYFNYGIDKMEDILKEASYLSFDEEKKYLIIKDCALFNTLKDETEENILTDYLTHPNPNSVLIFLVNVFDKRKKIGKILSENGKIIEIPKINYQNIYTYLNNYVKEANYTIEYKATSYLVNSFGLDLDNMINELNKVILYYDKPGLIKETDILKIVSSPLDNNNFHFVDAVINKKYKEMLSIYHDLKINKVEDIALIILLAREYRLIYYVKKMSQDKKDIASIMKEMQMLEWQVRKLYNESLNYSEKELLSNIKKLAQLDFGLKTGTINKESAMDSFFISLMV